MRRIDRKTGLKGLLLPGVAFGFAALSVFTDWRDGRMSANVGAGVNNPCLARAGIPQNAAPAAAIAAIYDHTFFSPFYSAGHAGAQAVGGTDPGRDFHAATLFRDFDEIALVADRKTSFISIVLPIVFRVNEEILSERRLVEAAVACRGRGRSPDFVLQPRIRSFHERYETDGDLDALLRRMDVVPPSLAIAQAAIESGWGRSRFVVLGNALFGQRTTNPARGVRPMNLPDTTRVRVAVFDHLTASVRSYVRNLNTHPAYRAFRDRRAAFRRNGEELDGFALAETLAAYSTRRQAYVRDLRSIIRANRLADFDAAVTMAPQARRTSGSET